MFQHMRLIRRVSDPEYGVRDNKQAVLEQIEEERKLCWLIQIVSCLRRFLTRRVCLFLVWWRQAGPLSCPLERAVILS